MGALTVTQRRSRNGSNQRQLDTLRSLGLRRIGQAVEIDDSPQVRGMLHAVRHLVEVSAGEQAARTPAGKGSGRVQAGARTGGGDVAAERSEVPA
jgi:large subunit ribosomal protein L30